MKMMTMMLAAAAVSTRQMTVAVQACWATAVVADSTEVEFDRLAELVEEVLALDLQQCNHNHYHAATTTTANTTITTTDCTWNTALHSGNSIDTVVIFASHGYRLTQVLHGVFYI